MNVASGVGWIAGAAALFAALVARGEETSERRAERYKDLLWRGATAERAVRLARAWAKEAGFREIDLAVDQECRAVHPGAAVTFVWRDRTALFVRVGARPLADGLRIVGAHVDSPAPRVAADPVTEHAGVLELGASVYGGIKNAHWLYRPLRLVGVVTRRDGTSVDVDLGPEQGVGLTLELRGSEPTRLGLAIASSMTRARLADEIESRLGVSVEDFAAAEIYAVPAEPPRDVGFDRQMIGAHGQDDRALSFAALQALLEIEPGARTAAAFLVDREEIGSTGPTGARGPLLEEAIACLARGQGVPGARIDAVVREALARSQAISADVKSAINPNWPEVQEPKNASTMGKGPTLVKYTGHRGKQNASDAPPELARIVVDLAERAGVPLQRSESGKVDEGGGGTIAKFVAARGVDVIDVGVPLLSMHAPLEIVNKRDLSACVDLFAAFFAEAP
jgi:aspartyl aminopeptidase